MAAILEAREKFSPDNVQRLLNIRFFLGKRCRHGFHTTTQCFLPKRKPHVILRKRAKQSFRKVIKNRHGNAVSR